MTPQASPTVPSARFAFNATDAAKLFFGALLTGIVFNLGAIGVILLLGGGEQAPAHREVIARSP